MKMLPPDDPLTPVISFVDKKLNRRQFLKFQLKGALWLATGMAGLSMPRVIQAGAIPDISVVKGKTGAATRAAVEQLGGMQAFVKPGDKVVIKPNMSFPNGVENATNTKPEVVRELVAMAKEAGASRIRVLDHPLGTPGPSIAEIKDACNGVDEGITHALTDYNFYQSTRINDKWYGFNKTSLMKDVLAADCLIAAPTAKSHDMTGVSLSLKGMMGLVYDRWIMHQQGLDGSIVKLAAFLKPKLKLAVIDATRVLSTNGPRGPGKIIPMNTIIASPDMVAADAKTVEMCTWYGKRYKPRQISHIRLAHKQGLGRMDVENLAVKQTVV
jgi:uncharacterized protein (DUF362 family)